MPLTKSYLKFTSYKKSTIFCKILNLRFDLMMRNNHIPKLKDL